jgi:ATP-dependent Clp protease ATP-binding subunit ClpA
MFERFTGESRHVVVLAQEKARELAHHHIGTEHVLLALLAQERSEVRKALDRLGVTLESATAAVVEAVPPEGNPPSGHIPFTPRAKKVLEYSLREALKMDDKEIRPEHLLFGILAEGRGVAAQVLLRDGRTDEQIRGAVTPAGRGAGAAAAPRTPAAEEVLALAERLAGSAPVGSHHLLEALASVTGGAGGKALAGLGVTADALTEQIDALDLTTTQDVTPEQAAAATMSWDVDGDRAVLSTGDPDTVGRVRSLVEQAGGPLTGDGPLAGPFITIHRALAGAAAAVQTALNPPAAAEDDPKAAASLVERLRRRRHRSA